jgi:hypothetical protein
MLRSDLDLSANPNDLASTYTSVEPLDHELIKKTVLEWDWDIEHEDRRLEAKADALAHPQHPFDVDRKVLKDVVREKMGRDVARIKFLSSGKFGNCRSFHHQANGLCAGTFHKARLLR